MIFKIRNKWKKVGFKFVRDDERWFAWRPVCLVSGDIVWLQYITRSFHDGDGYGDSSTYNLL